MVEPKVPPFDAVDEGRLPLPVGPTIELEFDKGKGTDEVNGPSAEKVPKPPETVDE